MKKIIAFLLLITTTFYHTYACTTFFINKNGQMVFGRNYDWVTGNGMVCTNHRGLSKTSANTDDGKAISWVSQYGSITFNQYGKEFPTGGMNEKGLVVEMMWLDGTRYADADQRPAIGELQWIQYQLDNCATVSELIATDQVLRIASKGSTPLHFLVADATGKAATIEFFDGKMTVHQDKDLPFAVLTNDTYQQSLEYSGLANGNSNPPRSFTNNSMDRFTMACGMVKTFNESPQGSVIDYSFDILGKVAQGGHTKWSIVYDIANKKIYFKTTAFTQIKNLSFDAFDFACSSTAKAWEMNQPVEGNINQLFIPFSLELNSKIVSKSFDESESQFTVSEQGRKQTWEYAGKPACLK